MCLFSQKLLGNVKSFLQISKRPLVVILGPTASGKTAASIELAEELKKERGVEIVNADSRQLYKYLDIGTAKITQEEMKSIPHHLMDVLDPKEEVTAAWYQEKATKIIDDIHARKNIPMLVGGSMLYISAIIDGLEFPSSSHPEIRKKLEEEYDSDDGITLHKRLTDIDPETAQGIPVQNKPYVMRAMELFEVSGKKPSELRKKSESSYDLFIIGINRSREDIMERITERTQKLFEAGWMEEVRELMKRGYVQSDPGMKSHGYREIMDFLESGSGWGSGSEKQLMEKIAANGRQYAKRQMTWWRGDERILWIDGNDRK
jgi:tRNA dimethylallyltransferase